MFILSKYYEVEIAAVDIQSARVDIYGQNENYLEVSVHEAGRSLLNGIDS